MNPRFSFEASKGGLVELGFQPGLGRMAKLIEARHEFEHNPSGLERLILTRIIHTRIIQKFEAAFTLEDENYVPQTQEDDEINPQKRDEILFQHLEGIAAVCSVLRDKEVSPSTELQNMMVVIVTALKGSSEDEARFKAWVGMDSVLDRLAKEMMGSEEEEEE
ncbi:hypothetical protein XANCAGTX0491_003654 [Xanthoria calcicola]